MSAMSQVPGGETGEVRMEETRALVGVHGGDALELCGWIREFFSVTALDGRVLWN